VNEVGGIIFSGATDLHSPKGITKGRVERAKESRGQRSFVFGMLALVILWSV
jgi:hypothetical protein